MFAKYKQARPKKVLIFRDKEYEFPRNKWVFVPDPNLFLRIRNYPELFEVSEFNVKPFLGIYERISFEFKGGFIFLKCSDKLLFSSLDKTPFLVKQSQLENGTRLYKVTNCLHPQYLDFIKDYNDIGCDYNIGVFRDCPGWGDVQMSLSVVEHLKEKFSGSTLSFSAPTHLLPLAENNPNIDNIITLEKFYKTDFDIIFNLSQSAVKYEIIQEEKTDKNRIQLFAEACDLKNYLPAGVYLTDDEIKKAKDTLKEFVAPKKIGIFIKSFTITRNWDKFELLTKKIKEIYGDAVDILIFDDGKDNYGKPFVWGGLGECFFNLSIRDVLGLINECDLVIGPDTGPMHSAASMNIPTIWVFTHINGKVRTKGYNEVTVIQKGKSICKYSPCWYNVPCKAENIIPECSKAIKVTDVIAKIDKVISRKERAIKVKKCKKSFDKKILFKQDGTAGDVLLTTATIEGIRDKFPGYQLDYMTYDIYQNILEKNPYIDTIIPWSDATSDYKFVFEPHLAIINAPWASGNIHLRELYNEVCGVDGGKILIIPDEYKLPFNKYMVIHTTSLKQKTYLYFDEILENVKIPIVQIGGVGDYPLKFTNLDLRGKITFRQSASVLQKATFLLGIDSFPAHCASAVNTPSIIIFGATCSGVCKPQFLSTIIEPDYSVVCKRKAPCHDSSLQCNPYCINTIASSKILNEIEDKFPDAL